MEFSRKKDQMSNPDRDNHANQMNPNNDAYWQSRGEDEKPSDSEEIRLADEEKQNTAK